MPVIDKMGTWYFVVATTAYFGYFFFSVLLVINPEQSYYLQQPIFLVDRAFISGYMHYPGGLVDCCSLFLSQFYRYRVIGAVIITLTALAALLITGKILKFYSIVRFSLVALLAPVIALWYLHSFSSGILTTNLALLIALTLFYYHLKISGKAARVRFEGYLAAALALYFLAGGGGLLLLQVLCLVNELTRLHKKTSLPVISVPPVNGHTKRKPFLKMPPAFLPC